MKISYNWLKWYVPEIPDAEKLRDVFTYHVCEVEDVQSRTLHNDTVFDLNILPNRAHDLLSHQGIAREVAGILGLEFKLPEYKIPSPPAGGGVRGGGSLEIDIQTPACRRYMGRIVRNVKVGSSPAWVKEHLESIGQRSINNIVDATNIVMYDSGQPCHAFDLDKLASEKIIVRNANKGEKITLLTGEEKELLESDMLIADEKNALAIAGIKGGKVAEVDAKTKNILLEVANFDPVSVRKTSRRLGIFTDSSKRFENDLSPELCDFAMSELSALLFEFACPARPEGVEWEEIVDLYPQKQERRRLSFSTEKISKILGLKVPVDEIEKILKRYDFEYRPLPNLPLSKGEGRGGGFEIIVPPLRLDLQIEEDMAEEIGRVIGYDKIPPLIPLLNKEGMQGEVFKPKVNEIFLKISAAREKLLSEGYSEVMTYTFADHGEIEVLASASDKKFLRANLADGLKESLKLNQVNAPLLGMNEIEIFEIGTVWCPNEEIHVAYGDKKNIVEKTLDEFCKNLEINKILEARTYKLEPNFKMWSLYPFISRDIALWTPEETTPEEAAEIIKKNMGSLVVRGPELFDQFKKADKISYAFRLVFQSYEKTLTDEEVNDIMNKIQKGVEKQGWQVR